MHFFNMQIISVKTLVKKCKLSRSKHGTAKNVYLYKKLHIYAVFMYIYTKCNKMNIYTQITYIYT